MPQKTITVYICNDLFNYLLYGYTDVKEKSAGKN